ncbi:Anhydro-N-acetylmuramic acid kinase [Planktothrix sp. PCC 11201]|uniref:anhydro-N-acetylmuramic acid kinase n=1 Tax=Planktothrix sp. PCC 11201 TaxID=1729650 RepID=UPI00091CE91B|nr:anhydro-N-acetylmuramic acid kinase [Planktothrix sp. PCC 11201]SKB13514.1 Anhydro-N-acetylmuramic acid kinase [Planktothrix sp. PCC 11201]
MRVIGLISGTSVDGIDGALVEISGFPGDWQLEFLAGTTFPYPVELRSQILDLCGGKPLSMPELAELDDAIATVFAHAALTLQQSCEPAELIGSHGQTVFHRPPQGNQLGYSLQLGRGELIAQLTGLTTVSNFRVADIAAGGHGAPLVPILDAYFLRHPQYHRCIQNLGGIGNVTYLPKTDHPILGWDTGPGNALIDLAVQYFSKGAQTYDRDGAWAATGTPCVAMVEGWLQQDFFQQPPPKSTGRELFGVDYWQRCLREAEPYNLSPADILATLTELTAVSIHHSYHQFLPQLPEQILLCGGGSHNHYLQQRLQTLFTPIPVFSTSELGLNADFKEAITFAVLAYWRLLEIPGNLPSVTGAVSEVLLGEIHPVLTPNMIGSKPVT